MISYSERNRSIMWHPYSAAIPDQLQTIITAKDAVLFGENGKNWIDGISSWWVTLHGHCHPAIAAAIAKQAHELDHAIFAGYTHPRAIEVAEKLLKIVPGAPCRVFFSDNGSTAVEVALKMALQYWKLVQKPKTKFVYFEHAYHGDTFGAMAVGAKGLFNKPFQSLLFETVAIEVPTKENRFAVLNKLDELLGKGDIAGFIFEPLVQGAGGFRFYEAALLDEILAVCKTHDVFTIADEVMTGFGRTGKLFACDSLTQKPDMTCVAKGLTGGFLPLAATLCNRKIVDAFASENEVFFHGHSYTANPIACAAASANLDLLSNPECEANRRRIASRMTRAVAAFCRHPRLHNTRAIGTIFATKITDGSPSHYLHPLRDGMIEFFAERDCLIRPLGNTFYLLPPYCITDHQLETLFLTLEEYLYFYA